MMVQGDVAIEVPPTLVRLEEVTLQLLGHPGGTMPNVVIFDVEDGMAHGIPLFKNHAVGVLMVYMSAGSLFKPHSHPNDEWVVVVEGSFLLYLDGKKDRVYRPGEAVRFKPDQIHSGRVGTETPITRIVSITVPADPSYPEP